MFPLKSGLCFRVLGSNEYRHDTGLPSSPAMKTVKKNTLALELILFPVFLIERVYV